MFLNENPPGAIVRKSIVRQKWAMHQPALCCAMALTDPAVAELLSLLGFDCIWLDLEHHPRSLETAASLMRAARVGHCDIIARPAKGEFLRMSRMLEAGALGIMYPRCEHEDEAAEVVRWAKFPPQGQRGVDSGNADVPYASLPLPEYIQTANEQTFIFVQIEDPISLERVEKIAAVPGVDGIFFGPTDFSVQAGIAEQFDHPIITSAVNRISKAVAATGKRWGMPAFDPGHARRMMDLGASFLAYGTDIIVLKEGFELIQRQFASLGFTFDNQIPLPAIPNNAI